MIVHRKIKEVAGRCGGVYAEDRPRYETKIYCDRCGTEKPEDSDGAGWCSGKPLRSVFDTASTETKDICPDCIETHEERELAVSNVRNYIHHSLWARGSKIGRMIKTIEQEQNSLLSDCQKVKAFLNRFNPENKQYLFNKITQSMESADIGQCQDNYSVFCPSNTDPYP